MIEAAATARTITQAFWWLPPRKRGRRGSSEPPPTYAPTLPHFVEDAAGWSLPIGEYWPAARPADGALSCDRD
jgi:hypothetical protein